MCLGLQYTLHFEAAAECGEMKGASPQLQDFPDAARSMRSIDLLRVVLA